MASQMHAAARMGGVMVTMSALSAPVFAEAAPSGVGGGDATPDEMRALIAEMLADAESRSSLLQSGATAGHDGGFFLASPDGNFRMNISGQLQFRYTLNFRDDEPGVDDFEPGFTNPRTAIRFDGHIYEPNLGYAIQGNFDRSTGDFRLEDAYVSYQFDNGIVLIAGQYRLPILWEDVLAEKYSLAVDQSVVNLIFGQGRSQAIAIHYQADDWRVWGAVSDGIRSANTDLMQDSADYGVTNRWEWKIAGDWAQFGQFSSPRRSDFGAKLGAGVHWEQSPDRPGVSVNDTLAFTSEIMLVGDGWNAFLSGVGLYTDIGGAGGGSFTDYGVVAQAGVFVTERIEPFARWDIVIPDSDRAGDEDFQTLTVGTNYYLHGQAAKFTLDVQWFLSDPAGNDLINAATASPFGERGRTVGMLPSDEDDQFVVRAQFQVLF